MNFFDLFRRKKTPVAEQPKLLLPDGKAASPQLASLLPRLEPLVLPCIRITARPSDDLFIFESRFGGYPYWPAGKPYPVDSYGQYMYLLAQINFSELPPLAGYPDKGLLQFYLSADDLYGLDFDRPAVQSNFRVVYFEDSTATALDDFRFLDQQLRHSALPVSRQMALEFAPDKDYGSNSDHRYTEDRAGELLAGEDLVKGQASLEDELAALYPAEGHKIGGYAYFTQWDPRPDTPYTDYVLLLQVDSQGPDICWGDMGVGNFFIHPGDLARKDFSRVLYNWDCT